MWCQDITQRRDDGSHFGVWRPGHVVLSNLHWGPGSQEPYRWSNERNESIRLSQSLHQESWRCIGDKSRHLNGLYYDITIMTFTTLSFQTQITFVHLYQYWFGANNRDFIFGRIYPLSILLLNNINTFVLLDLLQINWLIFSPNTLREFHWLEMHPKYNILLTMSSKYKCCKYKKHFHMDLLQTCICWKTISSK